MPTSRNRTRPSSSSPAFRYSRSRTPRFVLGNPCVAPSIGALTFAYPARNRSGHPFPSTSPTAAPAYQPKASTPAASVALGEGAVAFVPQERPDRGGRDVEIRVPVQIEVRGDAPVAAEVEVGAGSRADVHELAFDVVEERAARQPTFLLPPVGLGQRVGVHDEQVEPSVLVVVEPAQAATHHGRGIRRHAPPEGAVAEAQPDLGRDVHESDAGRLRAVRRRRCRPEHPAPTCTRPPPGRGRPRPRRGAVR